MCQDQWDASDFMDSCANQQGCTDCASEGRSWCYSTSYDCDEVESDSNGDSEGWFWCNAETVSPTSGITSHNKIVHYCYNFCILAVELLCNS